VIWFFRRSTETLKAFGFLLFASREYESRNFLVHGHSAEDCDLIVCWNHNWAECPLEALELKNIVWN
jgi:hypothetical protein